MSLRAFHLFFIAVSILLCLGVGGWALRQCVDTLNPATGLLWLAAVCFVSGFVLIVYGVRVRQKLKGLGDNGEP